MKKAAYGDLKYSIRILSNGDGSYSVEVPRLPGCYSTGRSKTECLSNIIEAIDLHLEGVKIVPAEDLIPEIEVEEAIPKVGEHLISLPEACTFLDISDATLRRYIKDGKVPAYNFGKEYKFKVQELSMFIESKRVSTRSERPRKRA